MKTDIVYKVICTAGPSNEFIAKNKIFTMKVHCNEKYVMKAMNFFFIKIHNFLPKIGNFVKKIH